MCTTRCTAQCPPPAAAAPPPPLSLPLPPNSRRSPPLLQSLEIAVLPDGQEVIQSCRQGTKR